MRSILQTRSLLSRAQQKPGGWFAACLDVPIALKAPSFLF